MCTTIDYDALLRVLQKCRELTAQSEDSDWSCIDVREILSRLDAAIANLDQSLPVDIQELRFLFVVAGPLQETSMSNDWSSEFLILAELFDKSIGETS